MTKTAVPEPVNVALGVFGVLFAGVTAARWRLRHFWGLFRAAYANSLSIVFIHGEIAAETFNAHSPHAKCPAGRTCRASEFRPGAA